MPPEYSEVTTGDDPTKAVLSESSLHSKCLCDYVINVATGCRHGCKFCYVPSTPSVRTRPDMLNEEAGVEDPQREWGQYVLYRDDLANRLDGYLNRKQTWKQTEQGCGIVGISFSTDCYMDGRAGAITRDSIEILSNHGKYVRILTRNPILALQDLSTFKSADDLVTIGSSIPCMDAEKVRAIEPKAPTPGQRLRGLKEFNDAGIQTYVSLSPTYPTQGKESLRTQLQRIAECNPAVIFHEPINPRGANFEMMVTAARESNEKELARELEALRDREKWVEYSLNHLRWVQELGKELDLPIHLWPDKRLLNYVGKEQRKWLQEWRDRQSPEQFAERNTPETRTPVLPRPISIS